MKSAGNEHIYEGKNIKRKPPVMKLPERLAQQEKKIERLELDLNDLRQGLTTLQDYYCDLHSIFTRQEIAERWENMRILPLYDDDSEFDGIWSFYKEILIAEPSAHISCTDLYNAFRKYCIKRGRSIVDQVAFEFIFTRMENPHLELYRGEWKGCRIKYR